jgi:autotransporter-associated beta strand protein
MKTLIAAAIGCSLIFLIPTATYAINAQWDLDPVSGEWNTPVDWTPNGVPNGPSDVATFGLSHTTDVSISADTEVNSIIFTSAATNHYAIAVSSGLTLTLSGSGIINNSGIQQNFSIGDFATDGHIHFRNNASAGNARITVQGEFEVASTVDFSNTATAGSADVVSFGGSINFFDHATAGTMNSFIDSGGVSFFDHASAGNAHVILGAASMTFSKNSTAASANINLGDNVAGLRFVDSSTAGSANIRSVGFVDFSDSSSAGNATITSSDFLSFSGSSNGGTAQIELLTSDSSPSFPVLDISSHDAPGVTIGSLAGDEHAFVLLGANNLSVSSNNLSTTFGGVILDNFGGGRTGGSLTKIGSGTLVVSGANTYTGDTNVNRGVLQVDGSITSNTFVNQHGTLAGTGTINGNVTNNGKVSPGSAGAPGSLTIAGNYTQAQFATLMIQIADASADQFSVLNVLGNANLNGFLDPVLLNGFVPSLGDSFVFLNYAALTGEFSHIRHAFLGNGLQWSVIYEPNQAVLTVEQHVPDHGSTLLLLGLGLLGLLVYRRSLLPTKVCLDISAHNFPRNNRISRRRMRFPSVHPAQQCRPRS